MLPTQKGVHCLIFFLVFFEHLALSWFIYLILCSASICLFFHKIKLSPWKCFLFLFFNSQVMLEIFHFCSCQFAAFKLKLRTILVRVTLKYFINYFLLDWSSILQLKKYHSFVFKYSWFTITLLNYVTSLFCGTTNMFFVYIFIFESYTLRDLEYTQYSFSHGRSFKSNTQKFNVYSFYFFKYVLWLYAGVMLQIFKIKCNPVVPWSAYLILTCKKTPKFITEGCFLLLFCFVTQLLLIQPERY